ncbi:MAG: aminopeptidase P family protein [Deltaproteobacteria bacterium]|nr:aminopeptidase P family protein [Deltaproteobacteria bacterium]
MTTRVANARRILDDQALDALVVWNMVNVRYLSGFTGTEGALVITRDRAQFLTDSRYATQIRDEAPAFEHRIAPAKIANIAAALTDIKAEHVGYEDEILPVARAVALRDSTPGVEWIGLGTRLDALRLRKDPAEIGLMRRAARIAETGLDRALGMLRPGVTERQVALALEFAMREAGASGTSFDTIVASGPRGALPHGVASDRTIGAGEMVTIDFGCVANGYCSDQTVTIGVGHVNGEMRRVYDIVLEAQHRAIDALRPGVSLREVDALARGVIADAGFDEFFGHGLGHGVGMEIHESPRVSGSSEYTAEEGHVVTIEPGIYIPGRFGVRIEDTLVVTQSGCDRITSIDKSWRAVDGVTDVVGGRS